MKKEEIEKIKELEERIKKLEERPIYVPCYPACPQPSQPPINPFPNYPFQTWS